MCVCVCVYNSTYRIYCARWPTIGTNTDTNTNTNTNTDTDTNTNTNKSVYVYASIHVYALPWENE